ncbi:MAG TPA: nitroreductase family protein [Streptosporangiaceae bacterium]|nr:nitroreductase family protein [Streptosporangiaceae bacterium]
MQTWDAITARRNVRSFTEDPVSAEHLDRILEAGRRAPSSRNTQPWDFVLVTDRQQLQELSEVWVARPPGGPAARAHQTPGSPPVRRRRAPGQLVARTADAGPVRLAGRLVAEWRERA